MTRSEIYTELAKIADAHDGVIEPVLVVEAARPEDAPLHTYFTWDNDVASEKWRLHQARQLMRVMVVYDTRVQAEHRVFVSLPMDRLRENGGYRLTTTVMADEDLRNQLLANAYEDASRFARKYRQLAELRDVIAAIENTLPPDDTGAAGVASSGDATNV